MATHTQRAAEKLRLRTPPVKKFGAASATAFFNSEEAQYPNDAIVNLPYPTNDVRLMTKAATEAVNHLYRPGLKFSKAEELLMDLRQPGEFTDDLFMASQREAAEKVMGVLDETNEKRGRGYIADWERACRPWVENEKELMSKSYTTRIGQLWISC